MMKKNTILACVCFFVNISYAQSNICISVNEMRSGAYKETYNIISKKQNLYLCDKNHHNVDDGCSILVGKIQKKDIYSDNENFANEHYNSIKYLENKSIIFDKYNLAYDYAHSLSQLIYISENQLNKPINFNKNKLFLDFNATRINVEVGAYPKGILIPISYIFVYDKIKSIDIRKHKGKISEVYIMTDKLQRFKYNLFYKQDKLVKSEILFQEKVGATWKKDTTKTYKYFNCQ